MAKKGKELELPLWLALFMTAIFITTWFVLSFFNFWMAAGYFAWLLMTSIFLIPVIILWLMYFKVITF